MALPVAAEVAAYLVAGLGQNGATHTPKRASRQRAEGITPQQSTAFGIIHTQPAEQYLVGCASMLGMVLEALTLVILCRIHLSIIGVRLLERFGQWVAEDR